jgi:hypothetical protein
MWYEGSSLPVFGVRIFILEIPAVLFFFGYFLPFSDFCLFVDINIVSRPLGAILIVAETIALPIMIAKLGIAPIFGIWNVVYYTTIIKTWLSTRQTFNCFSQGW